MSSLAPLHRSDTDLFAAGLGAALARAVAPARLAAAGLLVVFAALLALPLQAQAQTLTTFVSNTDQPLQTHFNEFYAAQSFVTGANPDGYVISELQIRLNEVGAAAVKIRKNNSDNEPGDLVATLTNPVTLTADSLNTFTAQPGTTLALDASTTYWITWGEGVASFADLAKVNLTLGTAETGETGWSIGNEYLSKIFESLTTWTYSSFSFLIVIKGTLGATTTTTNTPATGKPGISGTAAVGQTLTATTSGITDADGKTKAENDDSGYAYTYQWILVDGNTETDISGETLSTYTPSSSDVGKTIKVRVSFTDDLDNAETVTSDATAVVTVASSCAELWCATLTVRSLSDGHRGCVNSQVAARRCSNTDNLTEDGFSHGGTDYAVTSVQVRTDGELRLFLNPNLTTATGSLVLLAGPERFAFAHADTEGVNYRYWDSSGLSWTALSTVELKLVEASTVATLSDLEIEDGADAEVALTPGFSSGTTTYTASVANSVSRITLTETPVDANAWVDYLDGDGTALTDLDTGTTGHQVDLDPGDNVIQVKVTAEDGVATRTYTVTVTREAGQPVTVDIEPNYDSIGAGLEDLVFTLTREGATTAELEATVTIVQDQSWLVNSDRSHTVTFTAGSATATLTLAASRFSFDPDTSGDLTATVAVAGVSSGEATVEMVSTADPPITISYDMSSYTFAEDAADVEIYMVATLDPAYPRAPSRSFFVNFSTLPDTATFTEDYVTIILTSQFVHGNYAPDASGFVARKRLRHNNGDYFGVENDEVYEGPEGLVVRIARDASLPPGLLQFAYHDGTTCESHTCPLTIEYPVTITDEEDRQVLSLSAAPASSAEQDDDTTTSVTENVSTLTVAAASPKTFATEQSITLTFGGTADYGAHYSVSPVDADANATGHQVVLPAETASVEVTVTAATNDTADSDRSILVTGSREGTAFGTATTITLLDDETTTSTPVPELVGAEVPVSGDRLILTYDVDLDLGGRLPPSEAFTDEDDGDEVTVQSVAEGCRDE